MFFQLAFNTIVTGLLLALVAVGFNLIFNVSRIFHLAHGAIYVLGAYTLIHVLSLMKATSVLSWITSFFIALLIVLIISFLIEWLVYRPLSKKNASQAFTLIASTGIYIFLVNLIALFFGYETRIIPPHLGDGIPFLGITIVPIQLVQFGVSGVLIVFLLALSKTKGFLKVRAVMGNETIASVMGVNIVRIRLFAIIAGGFLATIAAILRLYDIGIDPYAGMNITLSAAVAVIIGGKYSIKGTIVASLVISFTQTLTEWFFSGHWKETFTYIILIAVLIWRTEGIVIHKMRIEEK